MHLIKLVNEYQKKNLYCHWLIQKSYFYLNFRIMIVFKFGGASVNDAAGIKNLAHIVVASVDDIIVIVSALGKTTNALENVVKAHCSGDGSRDKQLEEIRGYHEEIVNSLFSSNDLPGGILSSSFELLTDNLQNIESDNYDQAYDQIVSMGEIWSTMIVNQWLIRSGVKSVWIDTREVIITDSRYRDANINWDETGSRLKKEIEDNRGKILVLQGFIGGTPDGMTTTLGREGSDFTAAVVANIIDANRVEIWKDVPGVMNADPAWMGNVSKLDRISYKEAVELSFSGAKVIHPKTIKPLHNKSIPLIVRSFIDTGTAGTIISSDKQVEQPVPLYVRKENQILLSFVPKDFSFVIGDNLGDLFHRFYRHGIKTNLVQASAVSIAVCVDNEPARIDSLIGEIESEYKVLFNDGVELLTLRYYDKESVENITSGRDILLEQRTRRSIRYVVKS